jgi:amino acid transporter
MLRVFWIQLGVLQWPGSTFADPVSVRSLWLTIDSYALSWLVTLPLEIVAASITLQFWDGARNTNPAAFVTIFLFVIISINMFGVRGYGEAEFVFSIIKVIAVLGFIILGIIIDTGGVPGGNGYMGAKYW